MLSYEEFKEKLVTEVTVYAPEKYKNAIVDIMGVPKAEGNVDAIIMRMPDKNQNEAQGQAELELNDDQIARNDEVCNAVFELCKVLTENQELEWDMEYIGDIADYASNALTLSGMKVRYPAVVTCKDGSQYIEEYVNCETNLAEESLNAGEER